MRLPPRKIKPAARPLASILLAAFCVLAIPAEGAALRIGCTIPPVGELVREVAGDTPGVEVIALAVTGGGCAHEISLTPGDIRRARACDVLVLLGLGSDELPPGTARELDGSGGGGRIIRLAEGLDPRSLIREPDAAKGARDHQHDHDHHHPGHEHHGHAGEGAINTHVWTSPRIMATLAVRLGSMLSDADPDRAHTYQTNAAALAGRLRSFGAILPEGGDSVRVVTMHTALDYFARDTGITVAAHILDGDESAPAPRDFARLVELCRADPRIVIVAESDYSDRVPLALARESGRPVIRLESGGGPSSADGIAGRFERNRLVILSFISDRSGDAE